MKRTLLILSILLMASASAAPKSAATVRDGQLDIFPGEDTIPILSWYCIMPAHISVEHYQELKDCGFNLSFPHTYRFADAKRALDCAAAVGIRNLFMCNELNENPEQIVPQVMDHPGLAGYHLRDEPHKAHVPGLRNLNERILAIDKNHFTYLNLLPNGASDPFMPYIDYIRYCSTEIKTPFISYDHYCIVNNTIRATYYLNLEIIAREAKRMNKPFWAFALSTAHASYPVPTVAQLKFQMYSNLAYGAQGLQYFTYWNPPTDTWDFHEAPILANGKRSSVYDFVREVNAELQKRNFVFMRSKVLWVRHTGKALPPGTTRLAPAELPPPVKSLDTHGHDAVVSRLSKGKTGYLVVVNASIDTTMRLTTTFAPGAVTRIRKDGTAVPADEYTDTLIVGPGECEVFAWSE